MIDVDAQHDVLLGFCHNGSVGACFMSSVLEAFVHDSQQAQRRWGGIRESYGPYIHDNRCRIARYFLEHTDKQWLWMVDNDIDFEADTLDRLLASAEKHSVGIVGAAYWNQYKKYNRYLSWLLFIKDHGIKAVPDLPPSDEPFEVSALGMGCTLIHRQVVQDVADMYPEDPWSTFGADALVQLEDGGFLVGRVPDDWEGHLNGREVKQIDRMGEDVTFCLRARRAGYPCYGLPTVVVEHYKPHFMDHGSREVFEEANGSQHPMEHGRVSAEAHSPVQQGDSHAAV